MVNPDEKLIHRLREQMEKNHINARELAERASVGPSFVYDILNGKSANPTTKKLAAIADVLGVSVQYLMSGQQPANQNLIFPEGFAESNDRVITIPALTVANAKNGKTISTDSSKNKPYYFRESWLSHKLRLEQKDLRIVFVSGDSMEPTLADGDMMLIDTSRNKPSPPGIFVIFDGEELLAKRLETLPGNKVTKVISDNRKYSSYEAKIGDIEVVGRVVWFAREL